MNNITQKKFIGIDVSKETLDIFIIPNNKHYKVSNDIEGYKKIINLIKDFEAKVVLEASGGYEINVIFELQKYININVWRVEPRRILAFKKSEGIYSKTDVIDSKILAMFAQQKEQKYKQKPITEEDFKLQVFSRRKDDLKAFLKAEKTRLQQDHDICKKLIEQTIEFLKMQIEAIDSEIKNIINNNNEYKEKVKLAQSMKGVGPELAIKLLVELKELGTISNKEIAALVGVAPYTNESGTYKGRSFIRGGRKELRKTFYMAALSAAFHNPPLSNFYQKLIGLGKKAKVALIAVARKMVVTLNAMFKKKEVWKESYV